MGTACLFSRENSFPSTHKKGGTVKVTNLYQPGQLSYELFTSKLAEMADTMIVMNSGKA